MSLFRETGRVFRATSELFAEIPWIQVMLGRGIVAPAADFLDGIKSHDDKTVAQLPPHPASVEQYCRAPPVPGAMG